MLPSRIIEGENRHFRSPFSICFSWAFSWALDPHVINFSFCLAAVSEL